MTPTFVVPAKTGIQCADGRLSLGPRFRGDDEAREDRP